MKSPATFSLRSVWQRRISSLLSAALCLWLLALGTHLHATDQDVQDGRSGVHYCGVCASIPSAAAAPAVVAFVTSSDREEYVATARDTQLSAAPAVASYRSRAPPVR
jgi:hypothetical protein